MQFSWSGNVIGTRQLIGYSMSSKTDRNGVCFFRQRGPSLWGAVSHHTMHVCRESRTVNSKSGQLRTKVALFGGLRTGRGWVVSRIQLGWVLKVPWGSWQTSTGRALHRPIALGMKLSVRGASVALDLHVSGFKPDAHRDWFSVSCSRNWDENVQLSDLVQH